MTGRPSLRRLAVRGGLAVVGAQVATAAGLVAVDQARKKDRPYKEFPRSPVTTVPVEGGELSIYSYGDDVYDAMLEAIGTSTTSVMLETFIWKDDVLGQRFKDALVAAHERGVTVHVIYDRFANLVVPQEFFRFPPGVHVKPHPVFAGGWKSISPRYSGRDHRKLLVVDDHTAFIGGYNIGALYATQWRDTHARLTGDLVVELKNAFIDFWNLIPAKGEQPLAEVRHRTWSTTIRVHRNIPRHVVFPIRSMYLEAIDRAEHHIYLTQAYFLPDEALTRGLVKAVERGVDVQIIVPEISNHVVADWISRALYDTLLAGGVRILRYRNAMVHAKTATIDGRWSTIGTANLDRLSLAGNYEINIELTDKDVAARMEEIFATDAENCAELTLEEWRSRGTVARTVEGLLSPWRPIL